MQTHEFVSAVQTTARIDTPEHAKKATQATLSVLGQRVSTEARHLASQLPQELAQAVPTGGESERFDLDEFYARVAEAEGLGCTPEQARQHARAVTAGLRTAVGDEYSHMVAQLPQDYKDLTHTDNVIH